MTLFTVLGYVTDVKGAVPYMCQPADNEHKAVDAWYRIACDNIGVDYRAFPPASAEHEAIIDTAQTLRVEGIAFLDGEVLALQSFELGED